MTENTDALRGEFVRRDGTAGDTYGPILGELLETEGPKWEYLILDAHDTDVQRLNIYGAEGWELIVVTPTVMYLKRWRDD